MYYWNKDNFEGLLGIGNSFKGEDDFELFAEYCFLKEKGLKKQAVKVIKGYVSDLKKLDLNKQRDVCVRLAELAFWNSDIHQLLSHPLQVYITDTFSSWCSNEVPDAPYTLLGYMTGERECFLQALQFNPNEQIALYRLAISAIDNVDYQLHHVSESLFLGDESNALSQLVEAKSFFNRMEDSKFKEFLTKEIKESESLLSDWMSYKAELDSSDIDKLTFPRWCTLNERNYGFSTPVYYDE